ncbi:MAG: hypothetical protein OEX82_01715, partial [Nitrosomonas sp.]|nr:hypothetical protein [Nitrosomonas sp.]
SEQKQDIGDDCISPSDHHGLSEESLYLNKYFHERLAGVKADSISKSTILCVPIPDNGSIPKILNDVFNIDAVSQLIGNALGTGEKEAPDIDVPIDTDHAFFETEIPDADEVGEDNRQEIRATGVLKFFDLVPEWLTNRLDASIVPFEDRWLATLDVHLKNTGHIIVSPAPLGMVLDANTNRRIIVTSFMKGIVNTNDGVPFPMEVELDYDPILGALDDEIDIPGEGQKTLIAINEIYDSGDTEDEQIEALRNAGQEQEDFMDAVVAEIIPDDENETIHEAVKDDELFEVELSLSGHRKDEIELILEQQVIVYVDPKHLEYAKAQLSEDLVFLTADAYLSFGLYNPGAPPEGQENTDMNDYLQLYLNIKENAGKTIEDAIILRGGPLLRLAKLKLPNHLPRRKPENRNSDAD